MKTFFMRTLGKLKRVSIVTGYFILAVGGVAGIMLVAIGALGIFVLTLCILGAEKLEDF